MMLDACSVVRASLQDKAILARALVDTVLQSCRELKSVSCARALYTRTRIDGDVVSSHEDIESLTGDIMLHRNPDRGHGTGWLRRGLQDSLGEFSYIETIETSFRGTTLKHLGRLATSLTSLESQ
jgi:hypothetical protein